MFKKLLLILFVFAAVSLIASEQPVIGAIEFETDLAVDVDKLKDASGLIIGDALDRNSLIEASQMIHSYLASIGFLYIQIPFPEMIPEEDGSIRLVFQVRELISSTINRVDFVGLSYFSEAKLREFIFFTENQSIELAELPSLMNRILQLYLSRGYLFASVELESLVIDESLRAVININEGKPFRIERYIFDGNKVTRDNALIVLSALHRHKTITPSALRQAEQNILRKSYIRDCQITPINESSLLIRIEEGKMTFLEGVLGYSETQSGKRELSGLMRLKFMNLWGTDRAIQLFWRQIPSGTGELEFKYHESGSMAVPVAGDFSLYRAVQDSTWIKTRSTVDIYYTMLYQKIGIELSMQRIDPGIRRPILIEKSGSESIGALWSFYQIDNISNPTRGNEMDLRYRYIFTGQNEGKKQKTALELNAGTYYPLHNRWVAALEFHARNLDDENAKDYELFGMGGYNSLRGYTEDAFRSWRLGWANYEIRYRITPESRSYLFFDHGFVADGKTKLKTDIFGFGAGIKVRTRLGILGIEYGLGYRDRTALDLASGMIHMGLDTEL